MHIIMKKMRVKSKEKKLHKGPVAAQIHSDSDSSVYSDLEDEEDESSSEASLSFEEEKADTDNENGCESFKKTIHKKASKRNTVSLPDKQKSLIDEYIVDSSDEEDIRNTVGNIPINWYDNYPHIGYDKDGKKLLKPIHGDELDEYLKKIEDPNYWRTVRDKMTGQDVLLTDEDVDIIQQIQRGGYPNLQFDPYAPFEDFFTYKKMIHPVTSRPESKRSFIPSLVEKEKVAKLVYAIKMGWIKPKEARDNIAKFYMLWKHDEKPDITKRMQHYISAPKMKLPGHEESYNPPPEYLFTKEEEEKWNEQEEEERKINFIPKKYSCLRLVPAYDNFIRERFERCLDLYLCPRQRKMRANVNPEDLIPTLPKPKDLQPFPSVQALVYLGHKDMVNCITVEPTGQFLASGSDDHTVRIWEVLTGRCLKCICLEGSVKAIAWCPNQSFSFIAVSVDNNLCIINPSVGDKLIQSSTDNIFKNPPPLDDSGNKVVSWKPADSELQKKGIRIVITHPKEIKQVTWEAKGMYFATVMPKAGSQSVIIHKLSTWRSQVPFRRTKEIVQCVQFHPLRPYFFVATQCHVLVYNLMKEELTKTLLSNCKWVSSLAIHPKGNNLIIGSYDSKLSWFDLESSPKPYKTLRYHKKAIRQVAYHRCYPLFASASDDASIIICHGMVYSDLCENPLIVPVKVLKGHTVTNNFGVLDCCFHPRQPWIFSSGSDGTIRLYT